MKVSVVIPVFNQCHLTERCLTSLLKNSSGLQGVCVVDNASQDNTGAILEGFQASFASAGVSFEIIHNSKNEGFGRACNQGIRHFRKGNAQFIVILNNDTWLMPKWDQSLLTVMVEQHLDCIGPYYYEKEFQESMESMASEFVKANHTRLRQHFVPILMCFSRDAIDKLATDCEGSRGGIFDERFFVTYEDADLLHRMKLLHLSYAQTGSCFIWHQSKGTRSQQSLPTGYEQEGLRLFLEKWGFDPRPHRESFLIRLHRKYWKWLEKHGKF